MFTMTGAAISAAATVKVAYATVFTLGTTSVVSSAALFAQVSGDAGSTVTTLIPATALTATSGALVWVVKQIAGGNLVHRDPAAAEAKLLAIAERLAKVAEDSVKRESTLTSMLVARGIGPSKES